MPAPKFTLAEFTGSLADLGTIIPFILIAVSVSGMKLGPILLMFGLYYIFSGLIYKLPVAVEPLKVVGAIMVSVGLTHGEVIGAGLFVGIFFLVIGFTGIIKYLEKIFPLSLIRGVQFGLALVLMLKGVQFIWGDMILGVLAVGIFVASRLINDRNENLNFPGALVVFALGIGYGMFTQGMPAFSFTIPLDVYLPGIDELIGGAYKAGIPQLPLTLTNAILATSLLSSDLFKEKISNKKLSLTIGAANVVAVPLGGFPMCHGAGGMAAHYKFGARTGGAPLMIGTLFAVLSFVATSDLLLIIPAGIMGTLLLFAGLELLRNSIKTDLILVTLAMGVITLFFDPTIALIAGAVLYIAYWAIFKRMDKKPA